MDVIIISNTSGGLGIRRIQDVIFSAFLSTVNSVRELVSLILNSPEIANSEIISYSEIFNEWMVLNPEANAPTNLVSQRHWDTRYALK